MDASKRSTRSLPDAGDNAPASSSPVKGLRNYLHHLAALARTTRFGRREVQHAESLTAHQQANKQLVNNAMTASSSPLSIEAAQATATQGDWISNLLHQEITGVTPLLKAIDEGNTEFALTLLRNGALAKTTIQIPLSESDPDIRPLFKQASLTSQEGMNKCITDFAGHLFNKAPKSQIQQLGANALTLAILCKSDHAFISALIPIAQAQDTFFLDRPDGNGRTALCMAAENNDAALIRLLLAAGANPNTKNGQKLSPLLIAASHGHTTSMIALLKACTEPDVKASALLELCYEKKNPDAFSAYQALSSAHRKDVLKFFKKKVALVLQGTVQDLHDYLALTKPLITDKRLARMAISAAALPDSFSRFIAITSMMKEKFSDAQLKTLRLAAAESENAAIFDYAAANDGTLSMLQSENVSFDEEMQTELDEELALALKAHSKTWVNTLFGLGARLDVSFDHSAAYPTLAQLADLGDPDLVAAFLAGHPILEREKEGRFIHQASPFLDGMQKVHTVAGFTLLLAQSDNIMARLDDGFKHALLIKAARLGSLELVRQLVHEGADLNFNTKLFKDFRDHHHATPISGAIEAGDNDMVSALLELGVVPSAYDISHRHACSAVVADALLLARAQFLNTKNTDSI